MKERMKVFVGVSGGVDSSVSLALLKEQGYDVTGVFLKVWYPDFMPCDWKEERLSAMRVCAKLEVPFLTIDCEKEYKKEVVDYMINEYRNGRVPNPDIFCNKYVKFGVFLDKAKELGADFIATGHYAIKQEIVNDEKKIVNYELKESNDKEKDQSYFLYTLTQEQLKYIIFPIGHLKKPEVRRLAEKFKLPTATKKDSQGLCFMGNIDIKEFLSHYIKSKKGNVLSTEGKIIGHHMGVEFLTIGQRHGFTITEKTPEDKRYFIINKNLDNNTIIVTDKITEKNTIKGFEINNFNFITTRPEFPYKTSVRIRYRQEKIPCTIKRIENLYVIDFEKPEGAVAEGQSAVFYDENICLGGGVIEKTF